MVNSKSKKVVGFPFYYPPFTIHHLLFSILLFTIQKIVFPAVPSLFSPPMAAEEMNMYCACSWGVAWFQEGMLAAAAAIWKGGEMLMKRVSSSVKSTVA